VLKARRLAGGLRGSQYKGRGKAPALLAEAQFSEVREAAAGELTEPKASCR